MQTGTGRNGSCGAVTYITFITRPSPPATDALPKASSLLGLFAYKAASGLEGPRRGIGHLLALKKRTSVPKRLQKGITTVLIKLDVELGSHLIREVKQLPTA